ncbi:FAD-binding oxidoreductase [Corynebacterium yudongzhengii]|uniref:D-lactate dehydrogenase (cytochrome) n=1 Tax=Corynebacterium yudongzhengii TaxID=2080740 RepID=A0A2U1T739_9CORY|nr:FAD-binding and (Fe-S)-binding domain-containing protein [Corynebacterium yudongzhengii]AWB81373.1 FAD-binding oxidoreductase [Corynebacterium yudongzhengii]PWC01816.1 FAD-binding oxidoreductase [Corynebacterium yudongzhengii]
MITAPVHTRPITRAAYAADASHYLLTPSAVVEARSAIEVAEVFRAAREQNTSVTLRSGGTSLSGQASGEGYLVDVRKHFRDIEVLDQGRRVRVQPGATLRHVNARLRPYGYQLGPDPASEVGATIGGVIANNSSGMACGTEFNAYRTLESLTFVLPSGTTINTADNDANQQLKAQEPELCEALMRLRRRILGNPASVRTIEKHFALKNTMGYGLNAFLDFETPVDILSHLLVGSEGTLAFVAEAYFRTVPVAPKKTTALVVFDTLHAATNTLPALVDSGAATLELMDHTSIKVGQSWDNVPEEITGFEVRDHSALLVEYHANADEELRELSRRGEEILHNATFTQNAAAQARAWSFRKGLYAQVAGARPAGTTALLEDVAVPVDKLADTCQHLSELFDQHAYRDAVIFGHAKDGNIHFLLNDRFAGEEALNRYNAFNDAMVDLVLGHGGNLKAEHGTGRAMAPYVRRQYGDELYAVMQELKAACDPTNTMNPGVILAEDPDAHLENIKLIPSIDPQIDACVECGYCESVCPSRDLTLTPRQRIVVRRAMDAARAQGDTETLKELERDYDYYAIDTCAADSMCVTACPVGIDTGRYVKDLRNQRAGAFKQKAWKTAAANWKLVNAAASATMTGVSFLPDALARAATDVARAVVGTDDMWQWRPELGKGGQKRSQLGQVVGSRFHAPQAVYVPACVHPMFGRAEDSDGASQAFTALLERAGITLIVPDEIDSLCCGTTWSSKGLNEGYEVMRRHAVDVLSRATEHGRLPVVIDASSCTQGFSGLLEEAGITVIDAIEFTATNVLEKLEVKERVDTLTLHPTCSATQLGLGEAVMRLARAAAREVNVPTEWNCCAYAGDRGMLHPELTRSATRREAAQVAAFDASAHASTNRTCELGMTAATGKSYQHVLEILERATR